MDLSQIPTAALVAELQKRAGVNTVVVPPYEPYAVATGQHTVTDTGPVVILQVWD